MGDEIIKPKLPHETMGYTPELVHRKQKTEIILDTPTPQTKNNSPSFISLISPDSNAGILAHNEIIDLDSFDEPISGSQKSFSSNINTDKNKFSDILKSDNCSQDENIKTSQQQIIDSNVLLSSNDQLDDLGDLQRSFLSSDSIDFELDKIKFGLNSNIELSSPEIADFPKILDSLQNDTSYLEENTDNDAIFRKDYSISTSEILSNSINKIDYLSNSHSSYSSPHISDNHQLPQYNLPITRNKDNSIIELLDDEFPDNNDHLFSSMSPSKNYRFGNLDLDIGNSSPCKSIISSSPDTFEFHNEKEAYLSAKIIKHYIPSKSPSSDAFFDNSARFSITKPGSEKCIDDLSNLGFFSTENQKKSTDSYTCDFLKNGLYHKDRIDTTCSDKSISVSEHEEANLNRKSLFDNNSNIEYESIVSTDTDQDIENENNNNINSDDSLDFLNSLNLPRKSTSIGGNSMLKSSSMCLSSETSDGAYFSSDDINEFSFNPTVQNTSLYEIPKSNSVKKFIKSFGDNTNSKDNSLKTDKELKKAERERAKLHKALEKKSKKRKAEIERFNSISFLKNELTSNISVIIDKSLVNLERISIKNKRKRLKSKITQSGNSEDIFNTELSESSETNSEAGFSDSPLISELESRNLKYRIVDQKYKGLISWTRQKNYTYDSKNSMFLPSENASSNELSSSLLVISSLDFLEISDNFEEGLTQKVSNIIKGKALDKLFVLVYGYPSFSKSQISSAVKNFASNFKKAIKNSGAVNGKIPPIHPHITGNSNKFDNSNKSSLNCGAGDTSEATTDSDSSTNLSCTNSVGLKTSNKRGKSSKKALPDANTKSL
ncbi:hypothetical protein AYI70_g11587, partial [Smittium culicis]